MKIPVIFSKINGDFKEALVDYLRKVTLMTFGPGVSDWLGKNFMRINDNTCHVCYGFTLRGCDYEDRQVCLDAHLAVHISNVKQAYNLAR